MSEIGAYKFTASCELHVVNLMGDSCPVNEEMVDAEVEVMCTLHCDDPEDGVYAEDITATIGDIELGDEAIELLDLSNKAGEVFTDNGRVPPKRGERYIDTDGHVWTVAGSGKLEGQAEFFVWLERPCFRVRRPGETSAPMMGRTVDEWALDAMFTNDGGKERQPAYRRVLDEPPPTEGNMRELYAIYSCPKCGTPLHEKGGSHTEDQPCWKDKTK